MKGLIDVSSNGDITNQNLNFDCKGGINIKIGGKGIIDNCKFLSNDITDSYSPLLSFSSASEGGHAFLRNSHFINNKISAAKGHPLIKFEGTISATITDCLFEKNDLTLSGGKLIDVSVDGSFLMTDAF